MRCIPSLLALACAVPLAPAFELSIPNNDLKVDLGLRLQTRLEYTDANSADGEDWDIWQGATPGPGEKVNDLNLMLRRGRLWLDGTYKENLHFHVQVRADLLGAYDTDKNRDVGLLYAFADYRFAHDDEWSHKVRIGRFPRWFAAANYDTSAAHALPTQRPTARFDVDALGLGVSYIAEGPGFVAEVGAIEAEGDGNDDSGDWEVYGRAQKTLFGSYSCACRTETFLGKEGHDLLVGGGVSQRFDGSHDHDEAFTVVADALYHRDRWSVLADAAFRIQERDGADDDQQLAVSLQAAYAVPLEWGLVVEPVARVAFVDLDMDDHHERDTYVGEGLNPVLGNGSGWHLDAGVNCYIDGNTHKVQLNAGYFAPEAGKGDAFILRRQHQVQF